VDELDLYKPALIALVLALLWTLETIVPEFVERRGRTSHNAHNLALGLLNAGLLSLGFAALLVAVGQWAPVPDSACCTGSTRPHGSNGRRPSCSSISGCISGTGPTTRFPSSGASTASTTPTPRWTPVRRDVALSLPQDREEKVRGQ